jgi:hypothetical protein
MSVMLMKMVSTTGTKKKRNTSTVSGEMKMKGGSRFLTLLVKDTV